MIYQSMPAFGTAGKTVFTTSLKSAGKYIGKKVLPDSIKRGLGFGFKKTASNAVLNETKGLSKVLTKSVSSATLNTTEDASKNIVKAGSSATLNSATDLPQGFKIASIDAVEDTAFKAAKFFGEPVADIQKATVKNLDVATAVAKKEIPDIIENTATASAKNSSNLLRNGAMVLGAGGLTALGAYVFLNDKQKGKQIGSKLNDTQAKQQVIKENTQQKGNDKDEPVGSLNKQTKTYIIIGVTLILIIMLFYLL
jgi:hypothetical protein